MTTPNTNWPTGARLPIPGNAEFALYFIAAIVVAIVVGIDDDVNVGFWIEFMKWTTGAYLLSRGIAKASRVLEQ
jgi:uncharacterized protein (DUF983 family)